MKRSIMGQWVTLDRVDDAEVCEQCEVLLTPSNVTRGRLMEIESRVGYARVWLPDAAESREYAHGIIRVLR